MPNQTANLADRAEAAGESETREPVLRAEPEHCPGAYVMHFYCKYDNPAHPYSQGLYMEEADQVQSRSAAIRQMREDGWIYHRDNTATCPLCAACLRAEAARREGEKP